jgi:hypothetical protein
MTNPAPKKVWTYLAMGYWCWERRGMLPQAVPKSEEANTGGSW